jgi:hypothetical protein
MADCSDSYKTRFQALVDTAKALSDAYEASHPNVTVTFFSGAPRTCDYNLQGWKSNAKHTWPYKENKRHCPRCDGTNIHYEDIVAGCRMNGDGYGSSVCFCKFCGILDWSSYDEA